MREYVLKNQKRLRCGITTGTCCAAAAKAAAACLLLGIRQETVSLQTPKGIEVEVLVEFLPPENVSKGKGEDPGGVVCRVVKDSGDDPDVTNGADILVRVECADEKKLTELSFHSVVYPNLFLEGGVGVGRVTKAGLEQEIGQAAINVTPRRMIFEAVGEICRLADCRETLLVTVTVPKGEELAQKTFNPRLGIKGGISILGTSGILEPMSERAIVDTIETEIRQRCRLGEKKLLIAPGNYGQTYIGRYLGLDMEQSIKCSNYIGETLDLAVSYGMEKLLLVGNIGKLIKLAAGIMNTHSKTADARAEIFAVHTVLCGGTREMAEEIMKCVNTEEMLERLARWDLKDPVMASVCLRIGEYVGHRCGPSLCCGVMLFSEKYGYLGETAGAGKILEEF